MAALWVQTYTSEWRTKYVIQYCNLVTSKPVTSQIDHDYIRKEGTLRPANHQTHFLSPSITPSQQDLSLDNGLPLSGKTFIRALSIENVCKHIQLWVNAILKQEGRPHPHTTFKLSNSPWLPEEEQLLRLPLLHSLAWFWHQFNFWP